MSGPLEGRVAIVTGAGQGIGLGIAEVLAAKGARVRMLDLDADRVAAAAEAVRGEGGDAASRSCDVSDPGQVKEAVDAIASEDGGIDILVNNAGITRPAMLQKMSIEDWQAVINVNLTSQFVTMNAVVPHMLEAGSGSIVNISSVAALRGGIGQVNYVAAKAGVLGLTKGASLELGKKGIRVNAVAPGTVDTDMTKTIMETPKFREKYVDSIVTGRAAQPSEIGEVVAFLASDAAGYITGQVLPVDGGGYA